MRPLRHTIRVEFEHRVYFTERAFGPANRLLERVLMAAAGTARPAVLVVVDEGLGRACPRLDREIRDWFEARGDRLNLVAPPLSLPGGEQLKDSCTHVREILSAIDHHHLDRHSYVLAIGGGALLDVVGLAAATAHRGVRHVRLPSTTLSQADSGVGVKNGVNAFGKKNFIGTFAVPHAVINDFALLRTLSARDQRGGFSEAVKVACVKDARFFANLERDAARLRAFEPRAVKRLIYRSAVLHAEHIASGGDPFEMASARPLDFGHWAAHKLEQLSGYRLRHGEAVAVGMALDTLYSTRAGYLPAEEAERVLALLEALGFNLFAEELSGTDARGELVILEGLDEFRAHLGGELTLTLLSRIGRGFEVHSMAPTRVAEAIRSLERRRSMAAREFRLARTGEISGTAH